MKSCSTNKNKTFPKKTKPLQFVVPFHIITSAETIIRIKQCFGGEHKSSNKSKDKAAGK